MNIIGATTKKDSQILLNDEAFKRRFSVLKMPSYNDNALIRIARKFEASNHIEKGIILSNDELNYVIGILDKKLDTQYFPDKLVDFIDYYYASRQIKDAKWTDVLMEYIHDNKFEIITN